MEVDKKPSLLSCPLRTLLIFTRAVASSTIQMAKNYFKLIFVLIGLLLAYFSFKKLDVVGKKPFEIFSLLRFALKNKIHNQRCGSLRGFRRNSGVLMLLVGPWRDEFDRNGLRVPHLRPVPRPQGRPLHSDHLPMQLAPGSHPQQVRDLLLLQVPHRVCT